MSIGLNFPFALSTGSLGYLEVTHDVVQAITANVRSLLLTNWGERVMHFDFGCNLREFLFEPRTQQIRARIADRVQSQLTRWMPFIKLTGLFVVFDGEDPDVSPNGFKLKLDMVYGNIEISLFQLFPV
jgi:phage baseplate assembly protein W